MAEDKSQYTKPDLRERIKNRVMRVWIVTGKQPKGPVALFA